MKRILSILALLLFLAPSVLAQDLTGAGASFPYPLYSKLFDVYNQEYGVRVNYQSIGSGGGQRQLLERTVNFAASDAALSDEQLARYSSAIGCDVLHLPMALGAVAVAYNWTPVADNPEAALILDGETLAKIFLGEIGNWNDPAIAALNPEVALPDLDITVAYRSDGSGTTFTFADYLAKESSAWADGVGVGTSVEWPTGTGAKGNEGVAGLVKQIPGAIGYVEIVYARQNDLAVAALRNASGTVVEPSLESVSAAGDVSLPDDGRVSITDTEAATGYPISTYTYLLVCRDLAVTTGSVEQARQLRDLLAWMSHDGQQYHAALEYGSLPAPVQEFVTQQLAKLTFNGASLD